MAVSNPCFELWLLLHHEECTAALNDYDAVLRRLRRHVPDYAKQTLSFARFAPGVSLAVTRAKSLDPSGRDYAHNPSSSLWRLVETIVG
jgi:hypothetical protein